MSWDGSVVIWPRRILFAGEAGQSRTHDIHAVIICAAYNGGFSVQVGPPGGTPESYSAALIEAGTQHSMDGEGAEFLTLMYVLPESEAGRELRRRYLTGERVYRVPDEAARRLTPLLEDIRDYWHLDCEKAGRFFDGVLGELTGLPPERYDRLDREVNPHVRRAVEELFSRMDRLLGGAPLGKEDFTPEAVADALRLPEVGRTGKELAREFKKSTGASFGDYVKLLRFRATLLKLARNESELRERLKPKGGGEEGGGASDDDREKARRMSLTDAARLLDWGELSNLDHASTDIIGISPNSLRLSSRFISCERDA